MATLRFENTAAFARSLDQKDSLRPWREAFFIPQKDGVELTYLCGNSLGLQPKRAAALLEKERQAWQNLGVEGWFEGEEPWLAHHTLCKDGLAAVAGALPSEVCPMNSLTVNMHLLLASFYQPRRW